MDKIFSAIRTFFQNETVQFVLICIGIVAAIALIAWLFEHFLCKDRLRLSSPKYITTVAVFSALAGVLMLLEFPLFFLAPNFYKLDFSELPVMICSFYLGPLAGVLCEFLKILIKLIFKPTTTAFVGELANFSVGCAFVLPASMIYHFRKKKGTALIGLIVGTLVLTVFGTLFNALYLLPAFAKLYGMPMEVIINMGTEINSHIQGVSSFVMLAVAPLNLIKGTLVSLLTMLLYKRIEPLMFNRETRKPTHRKQDPQE